MAQFIAFQRRMASNFADRFVQKVQVANTRRALQNLDDKTLADLGIRRGQINDYVDNIYNDAALTHLCNEVDNTGLAYPPPSKRCQPTSRNKP